ncbi:MAG: hypothetical protein AABZ94_08870 [Candidatus Eisenbacteria bacterium]
MNFEHGDYGYWQVLGLRRSLLGYLEYTCRNCGLETKVFGIHIDSAKLPTAERPVVKVWKLSELPFYVPRIPKRLLDVLGTGDEREIFENGRRAEASNLGLGALVYYRRVVALLKDKLLDEIILAATTDHAPAEAIAALKSAREERIFARSVELMNDAIPDTLRFEGHNPMNLLNSALGMDIHSSSDAECLEYAEMIREVLGFIVEKTADALRERKRLSAAVGKLVEKHEAKKNRGPRAPDATK